ncbi:MAG TPA: hypothetical protein VI757_07485 [Bacteroidia bacterium]|nr:hypothetical protein [Bacteroidia bacterium]
MEKLFKSVFIVIAIFFVALVLISANVFGNTTALVKIEQTTGNTAKAKISTHSNYSALGTDKAGAPNNKYTFLNINNTYSIKQYTYRTKQYTY